MLTKDHIAKEFQVEAGMITRMPMLILIMGLLATGTIIYALSVIQPRNVLLEIFVALCMMTGVGIFARYRWQRGEILLETLRHATQLLHTSQPQSVLVTSWDIYKDSWYLGIQQLGDQPDAPMQTVKVRLPSSRIQLENPIPAEIFRDAETSVVRLQDGRAIILASEPDQLERLSEYPLPQPPRPIPLLVQVQILTGHGMGFMFLCNSFFFFWPLCAKQNITGSVPNASYPFLIVGGITLILASIIFIIGYLVLRQLKNAPLGWARVDEVIPPNVKNTDGLPKKQTIHLHIRDQQQQEFAQSFITRQWLAYWPRHTEIPVLFDPTGHKKPLQVNVIKSYCRIDERGHITYRPFMVTMMALYFVWAGWIIVEIFLGH